jgi:hypothetical protein
VLPSALICIVICFLVIDPENMKELNLVECLDFLLYYETNRFEMNVAWESFHHCMPYGNF